MPPRVGISDGAANSPSPFFWPHPCYPSKFAVLVPQALRVGFCWESPPNRGLECLVSFTASKLASTRHYFYLMSRHAGASGSLGPVIREIEGVSCPTEVTWSLRNSCGHHARTRAYEAGRGKSSEGV